MGPTPGSARSSSMLAGTRPPCCSRRRWEAALMYLTLLLWKLTPWIRPASVASSVCSMFSTLRPCARSLSMTAALTVSLVCEESMRETRVWYSMSASPPSSDNASDPIVSTTAVRSARSSTMRSYVALQPAGGSSSGEAAALEAAGAEGFALPLPAASGLATPFEESDAFLAAAFGLATAFEEPLSGVTAALEAAFLPASVAFMQSGRARWVATIKARGWVSERERAVRMCPPMRIYARSGAACADAPRRRLWLGEC